MPPRVSPFKDAFKYVCSKTDKTSKLELKYINAVKGHGVFALASFSKGDCVLEYRGDMIDGAESHRRRSIYHPACLAFMFFSKWRGKTRCIEASRDDGSFGRLVNDEHSRPNCRMKKLDINGKPHLCLFALHDIQQGEEITYDYGGDDCPWRMKLVSVLQKPAPLLGL
ncbi:N-lysine methyltransferase KMT5A-like [Notolabrus celidotus]|uniref:N-lysine methyltransferase KMT5A-like n=1 Tax=Notolabrus celidotus TaxID=1203425 RepID=UPI00148F48CB|nr:N-lysine methyltransferase KMT5A-like [Notolabrus celidotus]